MTGLGHDVRYAVRQIRRHPGFATAAALTLALGIAATSMVFSFVDAAVLRPLPYPEPARLFVLWSARGEVRRDSLRLAVAGLALGLVGVLLSGRVLQSFLYEVEPGDPLTLLLVSAAVALLVTAAALVPARRAARTDPMAVLRGE